MYSSGNHLDTNSIKINREFFMGNIKIPEHKYPVTKVGISASQNVGSVVRYADMEAAEGLVYYLKIITYFSITIYNTRQ